MATWKRDFASGLVVVVPVLVTAFVVAWLYWRLAGIPVLTEFSPTERVVTVLVAFAAGVFAVGYLMRTAVGEFFERQLDELANRLPLVRVVYNASKMAAETAVSGTDELQRPVKLEPWDGLRMTAFKTGKSTEDGRDVLFLPTAPNITTGFVVEVDPGDYEATDESVEDALTRVLSAGFGESQDAGSAVTPLAAAGGGPPADGDGPPDEGDGDEAAPPDDPSGDGRPPADPP
jgi:uncharacterized membrane protein